MVSKAKDDLPEPESPVITVNEPLGISTSIFRRLCSRAQRTTMASCMPRRPWGSHGADGETLPRLKRPEIKVGGLGVKTEVKAATRGLRGKAGDKARRRGSGGGLGLVGEQMRPAVLLSGGGEPRGGLGVVDGELEIVAQGVDHRPFP